MGSSDNKRLAKNTGFLFFRMLLLMLVALYTSSIVVRELGANDYGIYGVVGGLVTMFSLLSAAMTSSITRFLSFDLTKGSPEHLKKIFSTSVNIQIILSLGVLIVIETFGVWFLNNRMDILPQRLPAANWVLQCAALTFLLNMISIPYNAAIIAHERMNAFAYISILESLLKLGIALFLALKIYDSLIVYAVLTALAALLVRMIYGMYCVRHFAECRHEWAFDKNVFKEIFSFSGWNFIGSISAALRNQGVNILMNLFFGTLVNAAQGIANQIYVVAQSFTTNFMTALNPQIIKSYASGNLEHTDNLIMTGVRLSYFLLMLLSIPIIIATPLLLNIWLSRIVPDQTVVFVRLVLIFGLSETLSYTLQTANQATGDIKKYQLVVGGLQLLNFPLVYVAYKLGAEPAISYIIAIVLSQIALFARLIILRPRLNLKISTYLNNVYWRVILVSLLCYVPLNVLYQSLPANIWGILLISVITVAWGGGLILVLGCTRSEREMIYSFIGKYLKR